MRPVLVVLAVLVALPMAASPVAAQESPRPFVVMNLAAHPDDEDGLTLAHAAGAERAVAVSVLYTRGEGGQNEAGPDLYERLGAVRTAETEAAARVLGSHVAFLNLYDFGFSKHATEAFDEWSRPRTGFWNTAAPRAGAAAGREAVTERLVRLVRQTRPDVLFTNHDTLTAWPNAQHGQHQAVGISAVDAMRLAADPAYHPEHFAEAGVGPWQPARLFLRQRRRGARTAVAVPVRDTCRETATRPAEACADRAVAAAILHVSQGFDRFGARFRQDTTYFEVLAEAPGGRPVPAGARSLLAGLDRLPGDRNAPAIAPALARRLALAAGPVLDGLTATPAVAVPGARVALAWAPRAGRLRLPPALPGGPAQTLDLAAGRGRFVVPPALRPALPRRVRQYDRQTNEPPVAYEILDGEQVVGAGFVPVETAPHVVMDLGASPLRLAAGRNPVTVGIARYDAGLPDAADSLDVVVVISGADGAPVAFANRRVDPSAASVTVDVELPAGVVPGRYRVAAEERSRPGCGSVWERTEVPAAVLPDVAVAPGLRVGLVRSYDDTTERALRGMGASVTLLDSAALAGGDLDRFDTVVIDIRAYLVRADLRRHNDRLLAYVQGGGHVVVGYHKTFEWNPGEAADPIFGASAVPAGGFAPFPLVLGRDRTVEEDAHVALLRPEHPVFALPHRITPADWDGWVQERGLYFPTEATDARYERLVSMGDTGEAPLTTGLLIARVGEGTYAYSPLGWYRQLEALHAGAWRIFANLVSLPLTEATP